VHHCALNPTLDIKLYTLTLAREVDLLIRCFFTWLGSLASLFRDSEDGLRAPAGALNPSSLSHERAAGV